MAFGERNQYSGKGSIKNSFFFTFSIILAGFGRFNSLCISHGARKIPWGRKDVGDIVDSFLSGLVVVIMVAAVAIPYLLKKGEKGRPV